MKESVITVNFDVESEAYGNLEIRCGLLHRYHAEARQEHERLHLVQHVDPPKSATPSCR